MMTLVCSVGIVKVSPNAFESLSPESVAKSPSEVIRQKIDRLRVMVVICAYASGTEGQVLFPADFNGLQQIWIDSVDLLKTKIVDLLPSTRHSSGLINGSF